MDETGGFGGAEGYGDIEKVTNLCPCGAGEVVENHDNIPGARDHDVHIRCDSAAESGPSHPAGPSEAGASSRCRQRPASAELSPR